MSCFPDIWAPIALAYFTAVCSIILMIVIVSGNVAIIVAVVIDPLKKLRTPFNYFLVNLAVSDCLVGIVTMPVSIVSHFQEADGWLNASLPYVLHLSYFISATASVFSLSALSVDRFCAIKWPIQYRSRLNIKRCGFISACLWIISILVSLIYLQTGYIGYLMVFIHAAVLLTFIILLFTYVQVYRAFREQVKDFLSTRRASEAFRYNQLNTIRAEKKVTRAFLWILGFFIASYLPAIIMIYILQFCTQCDCDFRHTLRDLQFLLVSANSGMNPFICAIRLKAFRQSLLLVFKCGRTSKASEGDAVRSKDTNSTDRGDSKENEAVL